MKRGEISSSYLIGIILAVMGFLVVLGFLYGFDFLGFSEEEACRLSVLTRATSPELAQSAVPLKCETKKICLTARGGGDCSQNLAGENPEVIKLSGDDIAKEIAKVSADEMLNCWKLMGEGRLDLFGKFSDKVGLTTAQPACVICSRIAVDESVSKDVLERVDINRYMRENEVKGSGRNYIYAFTSGGVVSYASRDLVTESAFKEFSDDGENRAKDVDGNEIVIRGDKENRELAIVFTQFIPPDTGEVLDNMLKFGGTVAGATFLSPAGGPVARFIVANPGTSALAAIAVAVVGGGYGYYNSYQGQLAAAGYCGKFTSNREDAEGCSMVQGINYRAEDINALCPQIQGRL